MREQMRIDWDAVLEGMNVNDMWDAILTRVNNLTDQWVPLRAPKKRVKPGWMNNEIRRSVKIKKEAWVKWKRSKTELAKRAYNLAKKATKKLVD